MARPAFQRLDVEERRRRLLELGARLFTEHAYPDLSMAAIAREAGISKALLYHYFPSKLAFLRATLAQGVEEVRAAVEPDAALPPAEALAAGLGAYLGWIDANRAAYRKLLQTAQVVPEVRGLVDEVRARTTDRVLAGVFGSAASAPPAARTAVRAWLWFMDGACEDWIVHGDLTRDEVQGLLLGTLFGALTAAGAGPSLARLTGGA